MNCASRAISAADFCVYDNEQVTLSADLAQAKFVTKARDEN